MTTPLTCSATWPGGRCTRQAGRLQLCNGHYQQQFRGRPYTPLRGPHGADPRELVPTTVSFPRAHLDALELEAGKRGLPSAELHRKALAAYVAALGKRKR